MKRPKLVIVLLTWTFLVACNKFEELLFHIEGSIVENGIIKYGSDSYLSGTENSESPRTYQTRTLQERALGANKKLDVVEPSQYYNCADSPFRFQITRTWNQEPTKIAKFCLWVARKKTDRRCAIPGVRETCSLTCGACSSYVDSSLQVMINAKEEIFRDCEWVASDKSRCRISGIYDTCRETCRSTADILMSYFLNANGNQWRNTQDVWGESSDSCNWYGVKCANGMVVELSLENNNLTGSIPSEIQHLTSLVQLDLYGNALTGSIPSEIGMLTRLTRLELDHNALSGSIPSEIGQLTQLTQLDLDNNKLTGRIHSMVGELNQLLYLRLHNNALTGSIPRNICDLHIYWITYDRNIAMCS